MQSLNMFPHQVHVSAFLSTQGAAKTCFICDLHSILLHMSIGVWKIIEVSYCVKQTLSKFKSILSKLTCSKGRGCQGPHKDNLLKDGNVRINVYFKDSPLAELFTQN